MIFAETPLYNMSTSNKKAKIQPNLIIGFELECIIRSHLGIRLYDMVQDIYGPDTFIDTSGNDTGAFNEDYSIKKFDKRWWKSIEIATPALPINDALIKFEALVVELINWERAGMFYTNHTCGFHVNISEKSICDKFYTLNLNHMDDDWTGKPRATVEEWNSDPRSKFAHRFIKHFNPIKWKKAYRRSKNTFCVVNPKVYSNLRKTRNLRDFVDRCSSHYNAVNTENLFSDDIPSHERRLEIRVAGNRQYTYKTEQLKNYLSDVTSAASLSATQTLQSINR